MALEILKAMIPSLGNPNEKIHAAFNYADKFMQESERREQEAVENEGGAKKKGWLG